MAESRRPHANNVDGPFYVEYNCCTACTVPILAAPNNFAFDKQRHCYVRRQPETADETTQTIAAVWGAEFQCIRYRGADSDILRRLAELDLRMQCDTPPPVHITPVIRNRVTVTLAGTPRISSARDLAQTFVDYLTSSTNERTHFSVKPIQLSRTHASLEFAWNADRFHAVEFQFLNEADMLWHIWRPLKNDRGDRGAVNVVFHWLAADPSRFADMKWYCENDWHGARQFQATPW